MEDGEGMKEDIGPFLENLPDDPGKLSQFVGVNKKEIEASTAFLDALKIIDDDGTAEAVWNEVLEKTQEKEYLTWKAHAKLGELLGPGIPGQHAPSNAFEGDKDDRYFARQYAKADLRGVFEDLLVTMKKNHFIVRYSAPISKNLVEKHRGDQENYTPEYIIEACRSVMGSIDLDPASCEYAQRVVKATQFFTEKENGLEQDWYGNVFLNPPYQMPLIEQFVNKLIQELSRMNAAILLTNNNTDTKWFLKAAQNAQMICFTKGRIHFYTKEKEETQPTNGQAFFYYGNNEMKFREVFSGIGWIAQYII